MVSNTTIVQSIYLQVLGRTAEAAGLASGAAALDNGLSAAQFQASVAASAESQANITNAYLQILGRPPEAGGMANAMTQLASGLSLTQYRAALAYSPEARNDLTAAYQNELGRAPDPQGLATYQAALASGTPLSAVKAIIASGTEAQTDIANLYQADLGRAPDAGGLANAMTFIANGGSLMALDGGFVNSAELANDVTAAYQSALGHGPNSVALAAARSEIASGVPFSALQTELGELSGGPPPQPHLPPSGTPLPGKSQTFNLLGTISPQAISAGGSLSLVYSLLNNDALVINALVSLQPGSVPPSASALYSGVSGGASVRGFDPSSSVIQVQTKQDASFANVNLFPLDQNDTVVTLGGGASIFLAGVPSTSLHATNFAFV